MSARIYKSRSGVRLPSVTTVLSRFKQADGLIHWSWSLGIQGIDYRQARDAAGDAGSLAHTMVERHIQGLDPHDVDGDPQSIELAKGAFEAFSAWWDQSHVKVIATETSLISEEHMFGGTIDAVATINGALALLDWKSGNSVHPEMLCQLAAYGELWRENNPGAEFTGGYHLCRFSKTNGDFEHRYFPKLDEAWELFKLYRRAYDIDKAVRKRAS